MWGSEGETIHSFFMQWRGLIAIEEYVEDRRLVCMQFCVSVGLLLIHSFWPSLDMIAATYAIGMLVSAQVTGDRTA